MMLNEMFARISYHIRMVEQLLKLILKADVQTKMQKIISKDRLQTVSAT